MDIIFISEPLFPMGGTANRTLNLAQTLSKRGHSVKIITPQDKQYCIKFDEIEIIHLKQNMKQKFGIERRDEFFKFIIKNGVAEIVKTIDEIKDKDSILHYVNYYMALIKVLSGNKVHNPYIYDLHASAYLEANTLIEKFITRLIEKIYVKNSNIIVPTEELKKYFLYNYNIVKNNIECVPLAINTERNTYNDKQLLNNIDINSNQLLAVFHGSNYYSNIDALKRIKYIVENINNKHTYIKVLVLGKVGNYVSSKYFLKTGYVEDLDRYISIADIALLPIESFSLGMRTRVMDYMKNGVPIIAFKKGLCGFDQAIKENALISVKNLNEMEKIIKYCINDDKYLKNISKNAFIYLDKHHSYNAVGKTLESVYKKILSEKR